jgi:hypothetical protein
MTNTDPTMIHTIFRRRRCFGVFGAFAFAITNFSLS